MASPVRQERLLLRKISIVIPTLNEEQAIGPTLASIPRSDLGEIGYDVEIIVVDGNSKDRTREIAGRDGAKVVVENRKGYGIPIRTGLGHSNGDYIVKVDGDNTYPVEAIPSLVKTMDRDGIEFLTTDRFTLLKPGVMSHRNHVGNVVLSLLVRMLFQLKLKDTQSGMWILKADGLPRLVLKRNISFSQELKIDAIHFAKLRWKEVPISYRPRVGKPKFGTVLVGFRLVLALLLLRMRTGEKRKGTDTFDQSCNMPKNTVTPSRSMNGRLAKVRFFEN